MSEIVIRPLEGLTEREACVALQDATWGAGFADRVPASILLLAQETGGVASGAFRGGELVGFVFGITGVRDGELTHWSDMLAVAPALRGRGIGRRLKLHQRERVLALGVRRMVWTFDPLEARNAHLNLHRLGATSRTYRRDLYGASASPLHAGIGTDRLLCDWEMESERVLRRLSGDETAPAAPAPLLNPPRAGSGGLPHPGPEVVHAAGDVAGVVVPADIQSLKAADAGLARAWRGNVRRALETAFAAGYVAVDFLTGRETGTYLLACGLSR